MATVSAREGEVLELVGAGLTNSEIGGRLFISVRTVESHVSALLRKLDLADRKELAARAGAEAGTGDGRLARAPEAFTSFVGRRADLEAVATALATDRLVTLTGPGGIGKTRLAIEAGHRHPAPAKWFVDLVPATPDRVVETIAAALDVGEQPNRSVEDAVHEAVVGRPALIVLDNCEHVVDAVADISRRLLQRCPQAVVLATSRESLGVPGERVVPIQSLAIDDNEGAVTLFTARARAAGAALTDADGPRIVDICTRLEGMPLAIELAAARCASLGVDGVSGALDDRLRLLAGARGGDERHRSLRAVLDWSYELLDDEERGLLRRLSVFHGAFGLADAAAVTRDKVDALAAADALGRLAAKSLVVHARAANEASSYRLLETVREYGAELLAETDEVEQAHVLHFEWALRVAGTIETELVASDNADAAIDAVFDDLRAALAWAETQGRRADAHELARRLAHLAYARRFVTEAQLRYEQAAGLAADEVEAALDLLDASCTAFAILRGDLGYELILDAAERAERAGAADLAARAFALAAERGYRFPGEFREIPDELVLAQLLKHAYELDAGGDPIVTAQLAIAEAWSQTMCWGPLNESVTAARVAASTAQAVGDPLLESSALDALAAAVWAAGDLSESAVIVFERAALLDRLALHDPRHGAEQLDIFHMACDVPLARGDLSAALAFATGPAATRLGTGALHAIHRELVVAQCLTGRFDDAIDEAGAMKRAWENGGRPAAGWMAPAVYLISLVHGLRGDRVESEQWWDLGEAVCVSLDNNVRGFAAMRLALHEGRVDGALVALEQHQTAKGSLDSALPWSVTSVGYEGYLWSTAAEAWAMHGEAEAQQRIDDIRTTFRDHLWVEPTLLRAEGRLHDDPDRLRAAARGFAAIEARFEEAATLALLDGDEGDAGRATLAALGCTPTTR